MESKPNNWPTIVAALVIAYLIFGKDAPAPGPGPGPDPTPVVVDVSKAAHTATVYYGQHLGQAMDIVADGVESGKIATAEQLKTEVRKLTEQARVQAFGKDDVAGGKSYDQLDLANIPYDKFDETNRSKVAAYLREKAKGHGSVK